MCTIFAWHIYPVHTKSIWARLCHKYLQRWRMLKHAYSTLIRNKSLYKPLHSLVSIWNSGYDRVFFWSRSLSEYFHRILSLRMPLEHYSFAKLIKSNAAQKMDQMFWNNWSIQRFVANGNELNSQRLMQKENIISWNDPNGQ